MCNNGFIISYAALIYILSENTSEEVFNIGIIIFYPYSRSIIPTYLFNNDQSYRENFLIISSFNNFVEITAIIVLYNIMILINVNYILTKRKHQYILHNFQQT
jgi:hypothetical protein